MSPAQLVSIVSLVLAGASCAPSAASGARHGAPRALAAQAQESVRSRTGLLQRCYEDALREAPTARGKMRVRFTVASDGALHDVTVVRNELGPAMGECVRATMQDWNVPFRPPEPVVFEVPFSFRPVE